MPQTVALAKNMEFWHWYPEPLVSDLTDEQMHWQPEQHDTSITFALWHAYRAEDELVHALVTKQPSVFAAEGWAARLPVDQKGITPFGNGFSREQIARVRLDREPLLAYARAVGERIGACLGAMSDDEAKEDVPLPFFARVYPMMDRASKAEVIAFFSIGHVSEHLGEVQFIRGLLGLKGAPL